MKRRVDVSALRFREAIRSAIDACSCTIESVAQRCGVSRQTISYMLMGRCKMRKGTARTIADAMTVELQTEIVHERDRIAMLGQLITNIENAYNLEYAKEDE